MGSRVSARGTSPRGMKVIAVTGAAGKTTTAWLIASVLGEAGLRVGVVSDLGCIDATGGLAAPPDPARPAALAAWIANLARGGCTHAVVEVSHDMLAAGGLGRGTCQTVVVTGAAREPRSVRAILERGIVAALAPQGCLVAAAHPGLDRLLARAARRGGSTSIVAGLDETCDVSARPVARSLHGQAFLVAAPGQVMPIAVDVPVASFARNTSCAVAVGLHLGVPLAVAARGIEAAGSVAGRVERLDRGQEFAAFLDQPPSRHALASTLASLRRLTRGRLAVVAEQRLLALLGPEGFAGPTRRRCDDVIVVPADVLDAAADSAALEVYARVDRLLGRLGPRDCLLVLGGPERPGPSSVGVPLVTLVDGWLRLAHPPTDRLAPPRRAA